MRTRRISLCRWTSAAVAVALVIQAQAGEPSVRDLIALAPVLDSSDEVCRSLDVGGWFGGAEALAPRVRFRALYRAPNQFSLLLSDTVDDTPLVFCTNRKMLCYDPVGPRVYYSEDACFTLEMAAIRADLKWNCDYFLTGRKPHHIFLDFRSVLSLSVPNTVKDFEDKVVKRTSSKFELLRDFQNEPYYKIKIDLNKVCSYTEATFFDQGSIFLCLDKLTLNGAVDDEAFEFPAKLRLPRGLPLKHVRSDDDDAAMRIMIFDVTQASIVRSVVNRAGRSGPINIPELSSIDWDRARQNDKKFSKALKALVPLSLRTR
jgi:hypothetical protein